MTTYTEVIEAREWAKALETEAQKAREHAWNTYLRWVHENTELVYVGGTPDPSNPLLYPAELFGVYRIKEGAFDV